MAYLGSIHKLRWQEGRGSGYPNGNDTTKDYYVNLSTTRGEGAKNPQNSVNVVYEYPLSKTGVIVTGSLTMDNYYPFF